MARDETATGLVLTRARSGILVEGPGGEPQWCRVPAKGRRTGMPAPGDNVLYRLPTGTEDGWIVEVLPRKTLLRRYVFARIKEIAANIERLVVLATPREPKVSPRLVDRILAGASEGGLEALIVINKIDLFAKSETESYSLPWISAGYTVKYISATEGDGLSELEEELRGRVSLLAGASGVGKSALLNRLITDLDLDTAGISSATGRGVHTTSATFLYPFPGGGVVADTPGLREFFPTLEAQRLHLHFPEFAAYAESCEFHDCLHLEGNAGCKVREAVERGEVNRDRYQSYLILYKSILEGPKRGRKQTQG